MDEVANALVRQSDASLGAPLDAINVIQHPPTPAQDLRNVARGLGSAIARVAAVGARISHVRPQRALTLHVVVAQVSSR